MKYFALYDENGNLITFGTTTAQNTVGEISEAEYLTLRQEAEAFNACVMAVYSGEMSLEDVPEKYKAEVEAKVAKMKEANDKPESIPDDPIDEALAILHGEVTE